MLLRQSTSFKHICVLLRDIARREQLHKQDGGRIAQHGRKWDLEGHNSSNATGERQR